MFTLKEAFKTAKPHTDRTGMLPTLECIHVTDDGFVEASDRYTAVRVRLLDPEQAIAGLYSPAAIKLILAGEEAVPDYEGDFPNLLRLYPEPMAPKDEYRDWGAGPIRFDVKALRKFSATHLPKMKRGQVHSLTFTPGTTRTEPMLVTIDGVNADHWRALIVPMRPPVN